MGKPVAVHTRLNRSWLTHTCSACSVVAMLNCLAIWGWGSVLTDHQKQRQDLGQTASYGTAAVAASCATVECGSGCPA